MTNLIPNTSEYNLDPEEIEDEIAYRAEMEADKEAGR